MRKLMILAAMLAMMLVAAAPAFAEHTSGDATAGGATVTAGDLANQCVQVANNVNTGNVDQDAAIINVQANQGAVSNIEQAIAQTQTTAITTDGGAIAPGPGDFVAGVQVGVNIAEVTQNVDQTNIQANESEINQTGITQVNNAQLTCEQAIAQVK